MVIPADVRFARGAGRAIAGLVIYNILFYIIDSCNIFFQLTYSLFGALGGPLLGLFTLGMLFPWANKVVSFKLV